MGSFHVNPALIHSHLVLLRPLLLSSPSVFVRHSTIIIIIITPVISLIHSLTFFISKDSQMNRLQICTTCKSGDLCISGRPKVQHIHESCPKGHWTQRTYLTWLVGDLAYGGITTCLKEWFALLHDIPYAISVASFFGRDRSAFPFITEQRTITRSHAPDQYDRKIVHCVSRHPDHTRFTSDELNELHSAHEVIIHAHGPNDWTLECIEYVLSVVEHSKCTVIYNSEYTRRELHRIALEYAYSQRGFSSPLPCSLSILSPSVRHALFRLPVRITRSPYSRMEDRAYVRDLIQPSSSYPQPRLDVPWWIFTGRSSPEKNLSYLYRLHQAVPHAVLIICSNSSVASYNHNIANIPWQSDLSRIYNATDTYVCTSDYEGGPISAIEAMLHGNTVVSTPVGCMLDLPVTYLNPTSSSIPDILFEPFRVQRTDRQMADAFLAQQYCSQYHSRDILLGLDLPERVSID